MRQTHHPQGRLRLADHVRACSTDGQVILLDLARSKYIGVGGDLSHALSSVVMGWPAVEAPPAATASPIDLPKLAAPLLAQGLLTIAAREHGPAESDTRLEEATSSLNAEDAAPHPTLGWRRFGRVLHASSLTALQLRMRSLNSIVRTATRRRHGSMRIAEAITIQPLQEAVAAYCRLRLYVFTAHDRCLHDSLTLLRFLAAEQMFPRWVIGVRTRPFGAHSWLQTGPTVLNDQHEHVRRYQPILVV